MNPILEQLQPYPFEKLSKLLSGASLPKDKALISLAIGEPQHPTPAIIKNALSSNLDKLRNYPTTHGLLELRTSIARWLERRFELEAEALNPETQVIPVAGTREALFSFARAVIEARTNPIMMMPNPFYQIYEGAALFAGAESYFLNTSHANNHQIDFSEVPAEIWNRCQLIYLCSPGNPSGAVMGLEQHAELLNLAEKYDFVIASDECYSEIYRNESMPPQGLLQSAWQLGNKEFKRCVVFHSLSKRSNAPGLRSGFVAGDPEILMKYLKYRTYHGATLPLPTQFASIAAWEDEGHVKINRSLYRSKFEKIEKILQGKLNWSSPQGGFYLWPQTSGDDEVFVRELYAEQGVLVVPGSYLSRNSHGINPGAGYIRIALVAEEALCLEAAERIAQFI